MATGRTGMVRGTVLAALSALLTAVGHVAGGGDLPDLSLLAVLLPLLAGVVVTLAERGAGGGCRSLSGTVAVLGGGQLALHEAMVLLHPMAAGDHSSMLGMHAAVTLLMAVAVRHADAALAALGAALRRVLPRRPRPLPAERPLPMRPVPSTDLPARLARVLAAAEVRRGPPVWC